VKKESPEVTDKEIEDTIKNLWKEYRGDFKDQDDKWAESIGPKLGVTVKTMKELDVELRKAMDMEKKRLVEQKYQADVLMKAIEMANLEIPEAIVAYEVEQREASFKAQIGQLQIEEDQFYEMRGTTKEQLHEQMVKDSKEAIENDVFLASYAGDRKVGVTPEELEEEVARIRDGSEDKKSEMFDNPEWRSYIQRVVLKRKAYAAFLDEIAGGSKAEKKDDTKQPKESKK